MEVLAQVGVFSNKRIEWIFFHDFCGYLALQAQVMMDNIVCQHFVTGLAGASSAQGVLTQKKSSLLDAVPRGGERFEGIFFQDFCGYRVASDLYVYWPLLRLLGCR